MNYGDNAKQIFLNEYIIVQNELFLLHRVYMTVMFSDEVTFCLFADFFFTLTEVKHRRILSVLSSAMFSSCSIR